MTSKLTVAIVGAGPSGLTAAKSALEQGLIPTVFEKSDVIGGVWKKEIGNVWSNMHSNVSKFSVTFSDFPWSESIPLFPTASEIHSNLQNYAKHFNLEPYINCGNTVLKVVQQEDKKWNVQWRDNKNNEVREKTFDFVIVASGIYTNYYIPNHDNMKNYKGIIEHGQNYERLTKKVDLKGKKVIVVGASFSATDISADIVDHGATVINLMRRPYWIIERLALSDAEKNIRLPFEFGFLSRKMSEEAKIFKTISEKNSFENTMFASVCYEQNEFPDLYIDPKSTDAARMAISTNYMKYVKSGKITVYRNEIARFDETGVFLKDNNTHVDADVVLFCTGYKLNLDFLEKSVLEKIEYDYDDLLLPVIMYKTTFHPDIENFACVGIVKEPIFSVTELQGRWASLVFSGKVKLPPRDKMLSFIEEERKFRTQKIKDQHPHADLIAFADSIAEEINALPNLDELKTSNPELHNLLFEGIYLPANFRVIDKPEIALKCMKDAANIKEILMKNPDNLPLNLFQ